MPRRTERLRRARARNVVGVIKRTDKRGQYGFRLTRHMMAAMPQRRSRVMAAGSMKSLGSGVEEVRLDFGNTLGIPFDGDVKQIRQEIAEAVRRATERVLTDSGAEQYDFSMAMGIADGSAVPIRVTVIPPRREAIPVTVSIEDASRMVTGYAKCARLYDTFSDADMSARRATLDAVLRNAIVAMLPKASDASVTAIIEHARMTNGSDVGTVNACETECRLIARLIADATGETCDIPDKPLTKKPTRRKGRSSSQPGHTKDADAKRQETAQARKPSRRRSTHRIKPEPTSTDVPSYSADAADADTRQADSKPDDMDAKE